MQETFPFNLQRGCALPHIGGALGVYVYVCMYVGI